MRIIPRRHSAGSRQEGAALPLPRASDLAPCGIRHVRLEDAGGVIRAGSSERSVLAVFWRRGRPVASRIFLAHELPQPVPAASELVPPLPDDGPEEQQLAPPGDRPSIAAIVCTRDRPDDLRRCLASLLRCDPAPDEIIVVDNAPETGVTREVVAGEQRVRYVPEPRPGLSHARNRGIEASRAQALAFTDDDVEVAPDWIGSIARGFADPTVACVTGAVLPLDLTSGAACLYEFEIGGLNIGFAPRRFEAAYLGGSPWLSPPVWKIGAGANMAFRRRALAEVGLFDPRLGAGAAGCSEDSELWFRLLRSGHACVYDPGVVVHHRHRQELRVLMRQQRAYIRGHVVALLIQFGQDRRPGHLLRAFWSLPMHYLRVLLRAGWRRDTALLAIVGPQLAGWGLGPVEAWRRRREPGPPRLETDAGTEAVAG